MLARIIRGRQVRVFGVRVHHGAVGVLLCAGALVPSRITRRLLMLTGGIVLVADDWHDRHEWLP